MTTAAAAAPAEKTLDLGPRPWRWIPCAVGCDDPILVPPCCDRAWHVACADAAFRRDYPVLPPSPAHPFRSR